VNAWNADNLVHSSTATGAFMDPLDDVFAAMRVRSALYARLEAGAPWGLSLAGGESARFGLVVRGGCLLEVEGVDQPVALAAGDCYVLAHGSPYVLRDHPNTPTVSCTSVVRDRIGGAGGTGRHGHSGLGDLRLVPLRPARRAPAARPAAGAAAREDGTGACLGAAGHAAAARDGNRRARPGLEAAGEPAGRHRVRAGGACPRGGHGESQTGWLAALADARIGPALRAMHKDMARDWTVESLAAAASLSRSAFAQRFRERVGQAPLEYLTQWRMFKAGNMLGQGNAAVGTIAGAVGYESEAAFSKAFKREKGMAPGAWRTAARETAVAA
jgi:AraC-like DNA-binding protein